MDLIADFSRNGFWFLVLLTPLVFVHELGHFLVARWCGVRVEVFSVGFGRELLGFTDKKGTRWKFSLIPLGGYVRMFDQAPNELEGGEKPTRELTPEDAAQSFARKNVARRSAIVAAGPIANFLFAIVVLTLLYAIYGMPSHAPVVDEIIIGSAAEKAGMKPGDRIISANGQSVDRFEDLTVIIQLNLDQPLSLQIDRGGQLLAIEAAPMIIVEKDLLGNEQRIGRLGIKSTQPGKVQQLNLAESLGEAVGETWRTSLNMLSGLWQMLVGIRPSDELGGVLRIAKMSGDVAEFGLASLVSLAVLLSINLGLINLFPIPLLDGGHLAFYAVEVVRGRPLSERAQEWSLRFGLAFVLSLMLFATWNDLVYLKVGDYFKWLFT
jgi:regulator of sigma E protease